MGEFRRLYYQTKEKGSFKTFKWVLKGRWNQGTGNSGDTRTYQQWDELGISYVGSDGVKYGPTYWTVDSFSSSGTPWAGDVRGPADLFDGEWGSETSKCDYKGIDDTNGYVEIIIHTTSGQAIVPNGVGLISANYQTNFESSTPGHFILYGLDERTNEYVQLIDVPAANVNKGNTQTTTVSFEPLEVISGTYYLLAPSEIGHGVGLRGTVPELVYLTYFDDVSTSLGYINSTPLIDTANIGNLVSISNRFHKETFVTTNGTMPSTYVGKNALGRTNGSSTYHNDGLTWNFPYSRTDKFTVQWWALFNQKDAGIIGPQVYTSPQYDWVHSFRNHFVSGYGFLWYGENSSVLTGYNGGVVGNLDGPSIKISSIPRSTWHHFAVVSDGSDLHFYVDGVRYGRRSGSWTSGDFLKFLMFDDGGGTSYTLDVTEIAIYDGDMSYNDHNNIPVPTKPLKTPHVPGEGEVTIGNQTWKIENLAIDDGQGGIITQTVNYGHGNVTEYYYDWNAAARVAATVQGWHLPTTAEWDALANTVGGSSTAGTYLKSSYGWSSGNGTDDYGFSALPAGNYFKSFGNFGTAAYFWTADQISANYGYYRYFGTNASMNSNTSLTKSWKLSVRLIKDA